MDYIPSVLQASHPIDKVPYLGAVRYDDKGFLDFPSRTGLDPYRAQIGDFRQQSPEITESFLQAWLYFGLICELFEFTFDEERFTTSDERGHKLVTCSFLPEYTSKRTKQIFELDHDERHKSLDHMARCLNRTSDVLINLVRASSDRDLPPNMLLLHNSSTPSPVQALVLTSIQVLHGTLNTFHALMQERFACRQCAPEDESAVESTSTYRPISHLPQIESRMLGSGWCRNDVARFRSMFDASTIYYASFIPKSTEIADHAECSDKECKRNNIDEETYRTVHVTKDCDCAFLRPDMEAMHRIVRGGGTPLVRLLDIENGQTSLSVVSVHEDEQLAISISLHNINKPTVRSHYIAFSHVWSHGLGNTKENALPLCQLRKLQSLANELITPQDRSLFGVTQSDPNQVNVPFWIDTLSIPREKAVRRLAISGLRFVYDTADKVLVLDPELESVSSADMTGEEQLMRLASSSWMRRIWTLQEAVQARQLYARYRDKSIDIHAVQARLMDEESNSNLPVNAIRSKLTVLFNSIFICSNQSISSNIKFGFSWNNAFYRSTTNSFDYSLVLAGLLDVDTRDISNKSEPEAFEHILANTNPYLPKEILFLSGPRVKTPGRRWMVQSFSKSQLNPDLNDDSRGVGHRTPEGLEFTCAGFVAIEAPSMLPPFFYILDINSGRWCQVIRERDASNDDDFDQKPWLETGWPSHDSPSWKSREAYSMDPDSDFYVPFTKTKPMAIILQRGSLENLSSNTRGVMIEYHPESSSSSTTTTTTTTSSASTTSDETQSLTNLFSHSQQQSQQQKQRSEIVKGVFRTSVFVLPEHLRSKFSGNDILPDFNRICRRHRNRLELGLPLIHYRDVIVGKAVGEEQAWCVG